MKATKKNIRIVAKQDLQEKNLTAFCRSMKAMNILDKWEIIGKCKAVLGMRDYNRIFSLLCSPDCNRYGAYDRKCLNSLSLRALHHNTCDAPSWGESLVEFVKRQKTAGTYRKRLFVGNKNIYWCSPDYGHRDYNKSVWRENTPENREKMQIINNYLDK